MVGLRIKAVGCWCVGVVSLLLDPYVYVTPVPLVQSTSLSLS